MSDIPDQPVVRRIENLVQGNGQLDNAKPGTEVATSTRETISTISARSSRCQLRQETVVNIAQVIGRFDLVQQWVFWVASKIQLSLFFTDDYYWKVAPRSISLFIRLSPDMDDKVSMS